MSFKDSRTFKNLGRAFKAECRACVKYILFAQQAREDGFEQIAALFRRTATNELTHAKLRLKWAENGPEYTQDNLAAAQKMEKRQRDMYTEFAAVATEEGYNSLAKLFARLSEIETAHNDRFFILRENMDTAQIFCKDRRQTWVCRVCGHESHGLCSETVCPVCGRHQGFTQIKNENY